MDIIKDFIPEGRKNRPGTKMRPKYLCLHSTANTSPGADALSHARYLKGDEAADYPKSWHFTVDDKTIVQHLPTNETAFHAGDGKGLGNTASIGIEICENQDGDLDRAIENAARLCAWLIQTERSLMPYPICMKQHYDFSGKDCPRILRTNGEWGKFMAKVIGFVKPFPDVPADHWSAEEIRFCKEKNLMVGTSEGRFEPNSYVTRAELAVVAARLHNLLSELK